MAHRFSYDFIQAKLHGIHSKGISGKRLKELAKIRSIEKLYKGIFSGETVEMPESKLYSYIEKRFKEHIKEQMVYISKFFNYKNRLINTLILRYETDNLKMLISSHLSGITTIKELFEISLVGTLDYELIYKSDLSDFKAIKNILNETIFSFLLPDIEAKKSVFSIENRIDKFFYDELISSLEDYSKYERDCLFEIIKEEMNWQNISWAFRTKFYYKKVFLSIENSFLKYDFLIPLGLIEKVYELEFIPGEVAELLKGFPAKYHKAIESAFDEDGDLDLTMLERNITNRLNFLYSHYFYKENFNILSLVSFIFLKKIEYINVVSLVESLRYDIPFKEAEEL